jgi:two-component system KDP operon response regulator KdpE
MKPMKLMIVEENAGLRRLLHTLWGGRDDEIFECMEGAEAVSLCALEQPDWVILDLNLARADGLRVTQQICRANPQTRVMVVADESDVRVRDRAVRAGATHYVVKERMIEIPLLLDAV